MPFLKREKSKKVAEAPKKKETKIKTAPVVGKPIPAARTEKPEAVPRYVVRPHISEKGTRIGSHRQYVFLVTPDANKSEVKKEVEARFRVHVTRVNVINREGKKKGWGRLTGRRNAVRKAIVTLREDEKLDLL